jgi:hypothetical protein
MQDDEAAGYGGQEIEQETSRYAGMQVSDNSLEFLHDPEPLIDKLRHQLKRESYDFERKTWSKVPGLEPIMSDAGIEDLMVEISGRISLVMELGQLDERLFNEIRRNCGDAVLDFIHFKAKQFGLQESDFNRLFMLIFDAVTGFLSRPLEGFESKALSQRFGVKEMVTKRSGENRQGGQNQGKRGWLPFG